MFVYLPNVGQRFAYKIGFQKSANFLPPLPPSLQLFTTNSQTVFPTFPAAHSHQICGCPPPPRDGHATKIVAVFASVPPFFTAGWVLARQRQKTSVRTWPASLGTFGRQCREMDGDGTSSLKKPIYNG